MIKTILGTGDNICTPAEEDFLQVADLICPFCKQRVQIPIPKEFINYRSAYDEMKKRFESTAIMNGKLIQENGDMYSKIQTLARLLEEQRGLGSIEGG